MTGKQIITLGIFMLFGGVGLIIFAQHSMHEIDATKNFFDKVADFFRDDVYVKVFGGEARSQASKYDAKVLGCYYAGILLVIFGAITAFFGWIKKRY